MYKTNRILDPEFVKFMNMNDAWPKIQRVEGWLRKDRGETLRNGIISKMIQGMPVDPRHVVRFTDYLLMLFKTSSDDPTAVAFGKYLKSMAKQSPESMSAEKVAECLLATDTDPFFSGFQGMVDSFRAKITDAMTGNMFINSYARRCDEEDLADVSKWLYVWAAADLYPRKKFHSTDDAMVATETAIGMTREEFIELARKWRAYDEWTVVLAQGRYNPTGLTVVLPLARKAYESLREGERDLRDISSADLCRPSRDLLVVAIAQRPESLGGDRGNTIKNVFAAHVSQVAILSADRGTGPTQSLRLLALVGTPQNGNRAQMSGYQSLDRLTPDGKFQVFERVFGERLSIEDMLLLGFAGYLGQQASHFLKPPSLKTERGSGSRSSTLIGEEQHA